VQLGQWQEGGRRGASHRLWHSGERPWTGADTASGVVVERPAHLCRQPASHLLALPTPGLLSKAALHNQCSQAAQLRAPARPLLLLQGEFDLSLAADGLLAAALTVGLMVSAPTFSQLSRHFPALRLIGAGLRQASATSVPVQNLKQWKPWPPYVLHQAAHRPAAIAHCCPLPSLPTLVQPVGAGRRGLRPVPLLPHPAALPPGSGSRLRALYRPGCAAHR
jgi:hypothetical protein